MLALTQHTHSAARSLPADIAFRTRATALAIGAVVATSVFSAGWALLLFRAPLLDSLSLQEELVRAV